MRHKGIGKVLLCSRTDWANMGSILRDCLRSNNVEVDLFNLKNHPTISYKNYGKVMRKGDIMNIVGSYDIIQLMHSGQGLTWNPFREKDGSITTVPDPNFIKSLLAAKRKGSKVVVFHGGSCYRDLFAGINKISNPLIDLSIIQTPDLMGLGAKKEVLTFAPIDTKSIKPASYKNNEPLVIGHFPTSTSKKNSLLIRDTIAEVRKEINNEFIFNYSEDIVSHEENLSRISKCDVYIASQQYTLNGRLFSTFGLTTLEAAALGRLVITCHAKKKEYEDIFGKFAPAISNSKEELKAQLIKIITMNPDRLEKWKKENRDWVDENHSYENFGKKLINIYKSI